MSILEACQTNGPYSQKYYILYDYYNLYTCSDFYVEGLLCLYEYTIIVWGILAIRIKLHHVQSSSLLK